MIDVSILSARETQNLVELVNIVVKFIWLILLWFLLYQQIHGS